MILFIRQNYILDDVRLWVILFSFFFFFTVLKFLKSCRIIIFSKVVLEF